MHDDIVIDRAGARRSGSTHDGRSGCAAEAAGPTVTAARLALSAMVLPSLADALAVGDRVRMALLRSSNGHPVFTGRDADGQVSATDRFVFANVAHGLQRAHAPSARMRVNVAWQIERKCATGVCALAAGRAFGRKRLDWPGS